MKVHSLFLLAVLMLFLGCESDQQVTNITVTGLKGTLEGRVRFDDMIPPFGGVLVTIEGTNFSALSDDQGYWAVSDLPAGTYVIRYEKEGYGLKKKFGIQFVGGGISYAPEETLRPIIATHVNIFYAAAKDTLDPQYPAGVPSTRLVVKAVISDVTTASNSKYATFFFAKTPNVSSDANIYEYVICKSLANLRDSMLSVMDYLPYPFKSGDVVHVVAYGGYANEYNPGDYYDQTIHKMVFTSLSPYKSEVFRFIVP
jgi:hypothetical protein